MTTNHATPVHEHKAYEADNCPRCGTAQRRMGQMDALPANTTHYHAGHNDAGYLPESDVETFETFEDAKTYQIDELLRAADNIASWSDEHDCDDVPCPTFGDECPEQLASSVALSAEDLNLESGPEWFDSLSDGRSLPVSWWISVCHEGDCGPETDDECECSCHPFQAAHGTASSGCTGCGCGPEAPEPEHCSLCQDYGHLTLDHPATYVRRFDGLGDVWEVRWHGGATFNIYLNDVEVDVFTRYGDDGGNAPTLEQAQQFIEEWAARTSDVS